MDTILGNSLGIKDGELVGELLEMAEGNGVDADEGTRVGNKVGFLVGKRLGCRLGAVEGELVGTEDGVHVRLLVRL